MNSRSRVPALLLVICLVLAPRLRAQDEAIKDSDLTKMLKEAEEMQKEAAEIQKKNPPAPGAKKKLAEMEAEAKAEAARQEADEKREKEKLQAALKKQLEAPGSVALPDWTPATPQFKPAGSPLKKIVEDEVKIIVTGTSSLTPKELADSWEAAATAANNLNHVRNNISSNGNLTTILFLSTRTDPVQKVELAARRAPGEKTSRVEISSPLPKPTSDGE
ncbi:MAG: hypothetical protein QOC70_1305 [Verrucomicrobiota bacterium]|jgi:hypothetical protein